MINSLGCFLIMGLDKERPLGSNVIKNTVQLIPGNISVFLKSFLCILIRIGLGRWLTPSDCARTHYMCCRQRSIKTTLSRGKFSKGDVMYRIGQSFSKSCSCSKPGKLWWWFAHCFYPAWAKLRLAISKCASYQTYEVNWIAHD